MSYQLSGVVPWGRTFEEYRQMFLLSEKDLNKQIVSFGDGPASFNAQLTKQGKKVISLDPIYQFTRDEIEKRIEETSTEIVEQMRLNASNFNWQSIKNIEELKQLRLGAMSIFLQDFEQGKTEKRYINHGLPTVTAFENQFFDLGLSSHFLLLYDHLGLDFHISAIVEMLRISKEVRIFPILNLNAQKTPLLQDLFLFFEEKFDMEIRKTDYEFQKNGNEMLIIKAKTV
ncbi:hypothetical protein [Pseudopedobacter beijingensis]|uniref:SAM-dependent methyltransferase n=1 Tax=Pseudopedobacter beijingensis TaxID=1207056 RepID=A0ABW4IB16_9SPHI